MPIPTYTPGQVLAASDCNNWFTSELALKTSNQSVTSSTVAINDTQMFLTLPVSTTYYLQGVILYDATAGADIKFNFTVPAGAVMNVTVNSRNTSGVATTWNVSPASQTAAGGSGTGTTLGASFFGIVAMGGTAGNTQLVWAQNVSNATATRVLIQSFMFATRIG